MQTQFLAGWGEEDITPDAKQIVELEGQYYQRVARERHSALKTVALAISRADTAAVMVSIDTVSLGNEFCERVRAAIAQRLPALRGRNIILNATHTHSAPGLKPGGKRWPRHPQALTTEDYQNRVEARIVKAVSTAWSARRPCGVVPALGAARIGHCRRIVYLDGTAEMYGRTDRPDFAGLEGSEDSGVDLLFFVEPGQKLSGVIVNIACPSQVMEATYAVSSDYMGALRTKLKKVYGEGFFTLCQISAAGCQSPRDLIRAHKNEQTFWTAEGVECLSDRILAAVRQAAKTVPEKLDADPILAESVTPLSLPRRRASYCDYLAARETLARLEAGQTSEEAYRDFCAQIHDNEKIPGRQGPFDDKLHRFVSMRNNEAVIRRYEDQCQRPEHRINLHVVRVGETAFATNPFELFLEYGQRIKARSAAQQTFIIQLANDSGGYLPTPKAETLGGYGGLIINGQVGSDGGVMLVDRTLEAVEALYTPAP